MVPAALALLALPAAPARAEYAVSATVYADETLHDISPLSFGTNIVLSGMSNERMVDLVEPFRRMGLTNLRLHLNTGVDYLWESLSAVPEAEQCGWLKDKFGVSWQIIPKQLGEYLSDPDPDRADRAMKAILEMKKIEISELERVRSK